MSQTVAVGDGANDIPMIQAAGLGIAFWRQAEDSARRPRVHQRARPDQGAGLPALTSHDDSAKTILSRFATAPSSESVIIAPLAGRAVKKAEPFVDEGERQRDWGWFHLPPVRNAHLVTGSARLRRVGLLAPSRRRASPSCPAP